MNRQAAPHDHRYVVCVRNDGHEIDLKIGKLYATRPAEDLDPPYTIRVVDESGEDYLYAASWFVPVTVPDDAVATLSRAIEHASGRAA